MKHYRVEAVIQSTETDLAFIERADRTLYREYGTEVVDLSVYEIAKGALTAW